MNRKQKYLSLQCPLSTIIYGHYIKTNWVFNENIIYSYYSLIPIFYILRIVSLIFMVTFKSNINIQVNITKYF